LNLCLTSRWVRAGFTSFRAVYPLFRRRFELVFKLAVPPRGIPEHRHSVRAVYPLFRRRFELVFNLAVRPCGIHELPRGLPTLQA
jgi:hypothetical protein